VLLKAGQHSEIALIQHRTAVPWTLPAQARCSCSAVLHQGALERKYRFARRRRIEGDNADLRQRAH
jgi:hypothetical protein